MLLVPMSLYHFSLLTLRLSRLENRLKDTEFDLWEIELSCFAVKEKYIYKK